MPGLAAVERPQQQNGRPPGELFEAGQRKICAYYKRMGRWELSFHCSLVDEPRLSASQ
jgi:hypothetical protein